MNWRTMRESIKESLDKPNDDDLVDRYMIESLRFCAKEDFWFCRGVFTIHMEDGKYLYEMPSDYVAMLDNVWAQIGSDSNNRRALLDRTSKFIDDYQNATHDRIDYVLSSGPPTSYGIIEDGGKTYLAVAPKPGDDTVTVYGRYVQSFDIPVRKYDTGSSSFKIYYPDDLSTEIDVDTFETPWMVEGAELVIAKAIQFLYQQAYSDPNNAQVWAQIWMEHMNNLRNRSNMRAASMRPRGAI